MRKFWASLILSLLLVALLFSLGITTGHVGLDDWGYTSGCPFVRSGLTFQNVRRAFCDFGYGAIWMPATFVSYMADVSLFGDDWRVYHAMNVAFHLVNFVIVMLFVRRMLCLFGLFSKNVAMFAALIGALMWAVHPMRCEAVTWVASRKEELWTMFSLLGLMQYVDFVKTGRLPRYLVTAFFFIMACLSKPTAMCFPFLAAAIHVFAFRRECARRMFWLVPLFVVSIAVGVVTLHSQSHPTGMIPVDLHEASFAWRMLNACVSLGLYFWYTVFPMGVHIDYLAVFGGWPRDGLLGLCSFSVVLALFCLFLAKLRGWRSILLFAAASFLFSVGPALGVFGYVNGDQAMADRYMYFPHIALGFLVAVVIGRCIELRARLRMIALFAVLLVAGEVMLAVPVVRSYENGYAACSRALSKDPDNWRALRVVGNEYCAKLDRYGEGVEMLRKSLRLRPSKNTAESLAYILALKGGTNDFAEVRSLCAVAAGNPACDSGGMMLDALGIVSMREGKFSDASRYFDASLRVPGRNHSCDHTLLWLGICLANMNEDSRALRILSRAKRGSNETVRRKAEHAIKAISSGTVKEESSFDVLSL